MQLTDMHVKEWLVAPMGPGSNNELYFSPQSPGFPHLLSEVSTVAEWIPLHISIAGILLCLLFVPEEGGDVFPRNVYFLLPDNTRLHLRGYNSSCILILSYLRLSLPRVFLSSSFLTKLAEVSPTVLKQSGYLYIYQLLLRTLMCLFRKLYLHFDVVLGI
jgi:hypothetical protein